MSVGCILLAGDLVHIRGILSGSPNPKTMRSKLVALATLAVALSFVSQSVHAQSFIGLRPDPGNSSITQLIDLALAPVFTVSDRAGTGIAALSGLDRQPSGTLFASSGFRDGGNIYTINETTGAATLVGASGFPAVSALAFDQSGNLFGSASTDPALFPDTLISINTATGVGTTIGTYNAFGISGIDGLAFHPTTGILYGMSVFDADGTDPLFSIDPSTGEATFLGRVTEAGTGNAAPESIAGLTFDHNGNLYGSTGSRDGSILSIDIDNLTFTILGDGTPNGGSVSDLVAVTPVPEPVSMWLTVGLLSGLVYWRRNKVA